MKKYRDKDWLYKQYIEEKKTQKEISKICQVHPETIRRWMNRFSIPKKSQSEILKGNIHLDDPINIDKEWIIEQYVDKGRTAKDIGQEIGYKDGRPILNILKKENVNIRTPGDYFKLDIDREWLKKQYVDKERSAMDIANEVECSDVGIYNTLERFNISTRKQENHFNPTENFLELLDGTLLGDGWLRGYNISGEYGIQQNNKPYIKWMQNNMNQFGLTGWISKDIKTSFEIADRIGHKRPDQNKEFDSYTFATRRYRELKKQHTRWYPNGQKIIPKDIRITPLSVFVWFLEDGTISYKKTEGQLIFCTDGFNIDETKKLKAMLSNIIDIKVSIASGKSSNYKPRLAIYRLSDIDKLLDFMVNIPEELKAYYGYKFPHLKEPVFKLRR